MTAAGLSKPSSASLISPPILGLVAATSLQISEAAPVLRFAPAFGGSNARLMAVLFGRLSPPEWFAGRFTKETEKWLQWNLDVQPTLTVRPGWPVRAVLHKDLLLKPWRG